MIRLLILFIYFLPVSAWPGNEPKPGKINPCPLHILARLHDISRASKLELTLNNLPIIQRKNEEIFRKKVLPLMDNKNPYKALPKGISENLQKPFQTLLDFTRDGKKVFQLLQDFERKVVEYSSAHGVSLEEAFDKVLLVQEKHFGLGEPVIVTEFLDQGSFLDLLAAGRPIADEYWRGKPHTRDGHRIQSVIEAKYIEEKFGSSSLYLQLYKEMGNRQALMNDWKWEGTGINMENIDPNNPKTFPDVWAILHDTPFFVHVPHNLSGDNATKDFSNPEFFGDLRPLLPGLRGWL